MRSEKKPRWKNRGSLPQMFFETTPGLRPQFQKKKRPDTRAFPSTNAYFFKSLSFRSFTSRGFQKLTFWTKCIIQNLLIPIIIFISPWIIFLLNSGNWSRETENRSVKTEPPLNQVTLWTTIEDCFELGLFESELNLIETSIATEDRSRGGIVNPLLELWPFSTFFHSCCIIESRN